MPGLYVAVIPSAPRRVLLRPDVFARVHKLLLFLVLLSRGELTIIVDGTSGHTHDTVDVDGTMRMILSVIHGVTFPSIHNVAVLRLPRLVGRYSGYATDGVPRARHFHHLGRARGFFQADVSKGAASTSGSAPTHVGRSVELLARLLLTRLQLNGPFVSFLKLLLRRDLQVFDRLRLGVLLLGLLRLLL